MNVFWRQKPLAASQAKLLQLVMEAHDKSAARGNISTVVLCNAAVGSGDYFKSLAAALCTVGDAHAPLIQTYSFLASFDPDKMEAFQRHIEMGGKVPGWGNSFVKDGPDEMWKGVADHIAEHWPELHAKVQRVTDELHARGKMVWPNPSLWTAATAAVLEMPPMIMGWLFVQGRLNAWTRTFANTLFEHNAPKQKLNPSEKEAA